MPYEELLPQFRLLGGILKQPGHTEMDERLARLAKLIDEKIPDTLKKNAPPDYLRVQSSRTDVFILDFFIESKYEKDHAAPGKSESSFDSILERIICSMAKCPSL